MKIISFIENEQLVKKILKSAAGGSNANRLFAPICRRQTESFILYDESSSPSADDYIIDSDRSTQRLSTGGSRQVIRLKSPFKKSS
jgi:hypothetical protein